MIKLEIAEGYYIFKLDELLKVHKVSINKLSRETNTDFMVIKRYLELDKYVTVRLDLFVLARFCNYFHCNLEDLMEYVSDCNKEVKQSLIVGNMKS